MVELILKGHSGGPIQSIMLDVSDRFSRSRLIIQRRNAVKSPQLILPPRPGKPTLLNVVELMVNQLFLFCNLQSALFTNIICYLYLMKLETVGLNKIYIFTKVNNDS